MGMTLTDVLIFINDATPIERSAIINALGIFDGVTPSHEKAVRNDRAVRSAETLSQLSVNDSVTFPYDTAIYHGTIEKINNVSAKVKITKIDGFTRNRVTVGTVVKVAASILARGL